MASNTRWNRAGWGHNPSALRRQMPPSFMHRHDNGAANTERADIRFVSGRFDSVVTFAERESETWLDTPAEKMEEN